MPALKKDLRRMIESRLDSLSATAYRTANLQIRQIFLSSYYLRHPGIILFYYSIGREVETPPLILTIAQQGINIGLPVCLPGRDLEARRISDLNRLTVNRFGIPEPSPEAPVIAPSQIDLVVTPGLAFDKQGNRLGHGAGYYDRFLKKTPQAYKLGLAYDLQILDILPAEPDDVPVDAVITEKGLYEFRTPEGSRLGSLL